MPTPKPARAAKKARPEETEVWFCPNCARTQGAYFDDGRRMLDCQPCGWQFHIEVMRQLRPAEEA